MCSFLPVSFLIFMIHTHAYFMIHPCLVLSVCLLNQLHFYHFHWAELMRTCQLNIFMISAVDHLVKNSKPRPPCALVLQEGWRCWWLMTVSHWSDRVCPANLIPLPVRVLKSLLSKRAWAPSSVKTRDQISIAVFFCHSSGEENGHV